MQTPVTRIELGEQQVSVRAGDNTYTSDFVLLAVPPSTWDKMVVVPEIPADKKTYMAPLIKYLSSVNDRFWVKKGLAPNAVTDNLMTWEGTDNQMETGHQQVELTTFAGADAARAAMEAPDTDSYFNRRLGEIYPDYVEHVQKRRFMNWPNAPWTMGGYSCPKPGQVCEIGLFLSQAFHQRMFFAGEHTCPAFSGFMEGALESGIIAARRIGTEMGILDGNTRPEAIFLRT